MDSIELVESGVPCVRAFQHQEEEWFSPLGEYDTTVQKLSLLTSFVSKRRAIVTTATNICVYNT